MIDEVKVYGTILSGPAILADMNRKLKGNEPGLLAYWNFNDAPCSTTSIDKTANKWVATLNNGVTRVPSTVPDIGQQVIPNFGGNTGASIVSIYGAGFQQGASVKFTKTGYPTITADSVNISPDGTIASCIFQLMGADTGLYDVVLTDTNKMVFTYPKSFHIVPGINNGLWVQLLGKDYMRQDDYNTVILEYGNNGNVTAQMAPVYFAVSDSNAYVKPMFTVHYPNDSTITYDSLPLFFTVDSLFGKAFSGKVFGFYVPIIQPGVNGTLTFLLKTNCQSVLMAWIDTPYYQHKKTFDTGLVACLDNVIGMGLNFAGLSPTTAQTACAVNALDSGLYPLVLQSLQANDEDIHSISLEVLKAAKGCNASINKSNAAKDLKGINDAFAYVLAGNDTSDKACTYDYEDLVILAQQCITSFDPNYKTGPSKFQNLSAPFSYTIGFENLSTASGAAQQVAVVDTLDQSKFDFSTFSFGPIGWGDSVYTPVHSFQNSFSVDYNYIKTDSLVVRVQARLDTGSGVLRWQFISLDPHTLQPTQNALAGFLPPNKTAPEGSGFVNYSVRAKHNLPTGAPVNNTATVYFDYNAPIATQTYQNLVDVAPPQSAVNPIKQGYNSILNVSWNGTDAGSGIAYYNIYYNDNNGAWRPFAEYTDSLKGAFKGKLGHTYKFFSLATDNAGNVQIDTTIQSFALTSVGAITFTDVTLKNIPNPFKNETDIEFSLPSNSNVNLTLKDMLGNTVAIVASGKLLEGLHNYNFKAGGLAPGMYIIELNTEQGTYYSKIMIEK